MESLSRRVKPVLPYLILGLVIMATTVLVFKLWDASLATLPLSYKPGDSAMTLFRSFEMRNGSGLFVCQLDFGNFESTVNLNNKAPVHLR